MAMTDTMTPFRWGSGGRKLTPEQVEREREIAAALMQSGTDTSPVGHWTQGLARVAQALVGRIRESRADRAAEEGRASAQSALSGISGAYDFPAAPGSFGVSPTADYASQRVAQAHMPTGERASYIRQGLLQRGLPDHVADAFLMNFQDESGLDPGINERNPIVPGSRGGFGLYQLTGPRRRAYEQFAQHRGVDPSDIDAQLDFMMTELQGPESSAAQAIFSAPDTGQAAAAIVNQFLRPAEQHRRNRVARYTSAGDRPMQAETQSHAAVAQALMAQQPQATSLTGAPVSPDVPMAGGTQGFAPVHPGVAEALAQSGPLTPSVDSAVVQALVGNGGAEAYRGTARDSDMPGHVPLQPGQAGPSLQQLMQAASNPWLNQQEKAVLNMMLEQRLQQHDPMHQLRMRALEQQIGQGQSLVNAGDGNLYNPNTGEWITAPGAGAPNVPDSFQALQLRAQAAGLQPGTPEYQQFMAAGGRSTDDSAAVQRIDRMTENLMATGDFIDPQEAQNIAVGIVDGRLKADRHPITGELQVVDMATGRPVYGRGMQGQAEPSPMLPPPETPKTGADQFGQQFPASNEAFGVPGALAGGINRVTDAIGVGPAYPDIQQTQADFGVLRESLLNDIASAYGRQPPSWLLKEIRDLTPAAGSPFEGASGAQSKMNAIGRHLTSELAATEQALQRELSPQNRQELEARRAGLQMGIGRVTSALQSFGEQKASPDASQIGEGRTATNPQTGQRIIYRGGQWEPLQ